MSSGWFRIPGVQEGPRSIDEQMMGLAPALTEATGKTVLDLGCAEGSIALEFARAGALNVFGCDYNAGFIDTANRQLKRVGPAAVRFQHADIADLLAAYERPQYDIVLALAILHKLPDPAAGAKFCAQSARSLIVVRLPQGSTGTIRSKHVRHMRCDLPQTFASCGFVRERKEIGPRGEWVQYWRRIK